MTREAFNTLIKSEVLVFDGGMGTALLEKGMLASEKPETYNVNKPEWITNIHLDYLRAGAKVITTNTFGANAYKLKGTGMTVSEVINKAVDCAEDAQKQFLSETGIRTYIALDLGPIGALLKPLGELDFDQAYAYYKDQIKACESRAVDFVLIETQTDLLEAKCAVLAAVENCNLPVFCTMSFEGNGRTFTGTDVESMVTTLEGLGVSSLGINCSFGAKGMIPFVEQFLSETHLPILVQPNAGLPIIENGKTHYPFCETEFMETMTELVSKGVQIIGGCCGTTPKAIQILNQIAQSVVPKKRMMTPKTRISSYAQTLIIGEKPLIIGERINPTGKKKLKEALINGNMSYLTKEACSQVSEGAHILDVNVGLPEINETEVLVEAIQQIQLITKVPLQLDSVNATSLEMAARRYKGKPLLNSVCGKEESLMQILPIAKRYGACILGLTFDDNGLPSSIEGRVKIAEKIIKRALVIGIPKENILIDCLTLTASAQQEGVYDTLKALKIIKEMFGVCTVLGVSNVSFGLPSRIQVHQTFFTLALDKGLDLAIINPAQKEMMWAYRAFNVLKGIDNRAQHYIETYKPSQEADRPLNPSNQALSLKEAIFNGLQRETKDLIQRQLLEEPPMEVIEKHLMPILHDVGDQFERGELYLPQLIQASEAVGSAFEYIKEAFKKSGTVYPNQIEVILATVQHDVHDIGKNIVKIVLENYGFHVIDLGKDVAPEKIIETIERTGIQLVGLSALMTTTVISMGETVALLKKHYPKCRVVVGGAVLNEKYAEDMGADYYAKDPNAFVQYAKSLT